MTNKIKPTETKSLKKTKLYTAPSVKGGGAANFRPQRDDRYNYNGSAFSTIHGIADDAYKHRWTLGPAFLGYWAGNWADANNDYGQYLKQGNLGNSLFASNPYMSESEPYKQPSLIDVGSNGISSNDIPGYTNQEAQSVTASDIPGYQVPEIGVTDQAKSLALGSMLNRYVDYGPNGIQAQMDEEKYTDKVRDYLKDDNIAYANDDVARNIITQEVQALRGSGASKRRKPLLIENTMQAYKDRKNQALQNIVAGAEADFYESYGDPEKFQAYKERTFALAKKLRDSGNGAAAMLVLEPLKKLQASQIDFANKVALEQLKAQNGLNNYAEKIRIKNLLTPTSPGGGRKVEDDEAKIDKEITQTSNKIRIIDNTIANLRKSLDSAMMSDEDKGKVKKRIEYWEEQQAGLQAKLDTLQMGGMMTEEPLLTGNKPMNKDVRNDLNAYYMESNPGAVDPRVAQAVARRILNQ